LRRRLLSTVVFALFVASSAGGCIFFVNDDPSHLAPACHFSGDGTACGACMAHSCAGQVASCCGTASCMDSLAACAADPQSCGTLAAAQPDLGTCIAASCAVCFSVGIDGGGADTSPPGSTNCFKTGDECLCSVGSPNGVACNPNTLPGPGLCCADYGWPSATNSLCTCEPFSCTPTSGGADCSLGPDSTRTTTWSGTCCVSGSTCSCDDVGCSGASNPLSECTVNDITCYSNQVQVTSCSF
jgi:hypothetical protein